MTKNFNRLLAKVKIRSFRGGLPPAGSRLDSAKHGGRKPASKQVDDFCKRSNHKSQGFTLLELVITCTVLAILSLGIMPLVKNGIKRQKEQELRAALREMRDAIDAFKRDTEGVTYNGLGATPQNGFVTPRSKVYISDGKIFTSENIDYYAPDLDTLIKGVEVKPRIQLTPGPVIDLDRSATDKITQATKTYLRRIPDDPMTEGFAGTEEWNIQSCYQESDASSWDRINVFDVRSKSDEESLNGEKYSDW